MVYTKYGGLCQGSECEDENLEALNGTAIDFLLRYFGVQNSEREGIYHFPVTISGIAGNITKCEFDTVHTYLVFKAPTVEDILIDVTYRQFLIIPDLLSPKHFSRCAKKGVFDHYPEWFVGTDVDFYKLVNPETLEANMALLVGQEQAGQPSYREQYQLIQRVLFDKTHRASVCGKPLQRQRQRQENLEHEAEL